MNTSLVRLPSSEPRYTYFVPGFSGNHLLSTRPRVKWDGAGWCLWVAVRAAALPAYDAGTAADAVASRPRPTVPASKVTRCRCMSPPGVNPDGGRLDASPAG